MLEVSCVAFSPKSCVCLLWSCIPAPGEVGSPGLLDFGFLARPSSFAISWKTLDERTAHRYVCTFFSCSCVLGVTGPTLSKIPARGPFCDVGSGTQSWGTVRSFRPFFATSHANFNELEYRGIPSRHLIGSGLWPEGSQGNEKRPLRVSFFLQRTTYTRPLLTGRTI